MEKLEKER
jgi:hypothetical protein